MEQQVAKEPDKILTMTFWSVIKEREPEDWSPLMPLGLQNAVRGPGPWFPIGTQGLCKVGSSNLPDGWRRLKLLTTEHQLENWVDDIKALGQDLGVLPAFV